MDRKYKLSYFDVRALGEPIRWIFKYSKIPFEDKRISWDYPAWFAGTKSEYSSTVGQVPVLYVDSMELCQSSSISRYLATEFGLVADNAWDNAKADEVITMIFDLFHVWRMNIFERDPARKTTQKELIDKKFVVYYDYFNRILEKTGDFVVPGKLTHADFWLASFIDIWDDAVPNAKGPIMPPGMEVPNENTFYRGLTNNYPALRRHKEEVTGIPEIAAWIRVRPKTLV